MCLVKPTDVDGFLSELDSNTANFVDLPSMVEVTTDGLNGLPSASKV